MISDTYRPTLLLHNDSAAAPWAGRVTISRRQTVGSNASLFQQQVSMASQAEAVEGTAEQTDSGFSVWVAASSPVKDLTLFPDRIDPTARVDTGLVTLQVGQHHTFRVNSAYSDLDWRHLRADHCCAAPTTSWRARPAGGAVVVPLSSRTSAGGARLVVAV